MLCSCFFFFFFFANQIATTQQGTPAFLIQGLGNHVPQMIKCTHFHWDFPVFDHDMQKHGFVKVWSQKKESPLFLLLFVVVVVTLQFSLVACPFASFSSSRLLLFLFVVVLIEMAVGGLLLPVATVVVALLLVGQSSALPQPASDSHNKHANDNAPHLNGVTL